jgi:N-acetylglutamate synthase-like GNAT family acetyltransferase
MAASVTIRRAKEADAGGVLRCLQDAFEPYRSQYVAAGFTDTTLTPETLRQRMQQMTVLVARTAEGECIGTVAWSASGVEGHIRGMAVRPQWQGAGVAADLLAAAENDLRRHGCRRITLDTTAPLERAIAFYVRHGFQPSGKVGDFFGMPLYEYAKILA